MSEELKHGPINNDRRRFMRNAAMTLAAAEFVEIGSAVAQSTNASSHTTFGPLTQVDAGLLNVGYAEAGPANGTPVILLHGWPYDTPITSTTR